jgi:ubiquinone/menaquinone biosynthesis C-methylase UbiE
MSFDALAPHYRWMEAVLAGGKLQRCRTAFLKQVTHCQSVLIVGEGNGRFLSECRRRLKSARITCVDSSGSMLALAQSRLRHFDLGLDGVEFVQADALTWSPPERAFDLIVTHFFLDCFHPDQLRSLIGTLARAAMPAANWLLADFQIPLSGLARYRARFIHGVMYAFFRCATRLPARSLTATDAVLKANDFVLCERHVTEWGLLHSDRWARAEC